MTVLVDPPPVTVALPEVTSTLIEGPESDPFGCPEQPEATRAIRVATQPARTHPGELRGSAGVVAAIPTGPRATRPEAAGS